MPHKLSGKKQSAEHIAKRIAARFRNGKYKVSDATKSLMSAQRKGRTHTEEWKKDMSNRMKANHPMKGRKHTEESRLKMSLSRKGVARPYLQGANAPTWKGGKTDKMIALRRSLAYREWRKAVYKRDDYTCQSCGEQGGVLNADHLMPVNTYPELMFDVLNGRTLCHECHKATDTYGGKAIKFEQNMKFLITNYG